MDNLLSRFFRRVMEEAAAQPFAAGVLALATMIGGLWEGLPWTVIAVSVFVTAVAAWVAIGKIAQLRRGRRAKDSPQVRVLRAVQRGIKDLADLDYAAVQLNEIERVSKPVDDPELNPDRVSLWDEMKTLATEPIPDDPAEARRHRGRWRTVCTRYMDILRQLDETVEALTVFDSDLKRFKFTEPNSQFDLPGDPIFEQVTDNDKRQDFRRFYVLNRQLQEHKRHIHRSLYYQIRARAQSLHQRYKEWPEENILASKKRDGSRN